MFTSTNVATARAEIDSGDAPRGQSLVEFALVVPLLLIMALAVFDFARVYATAITIESAAREAADYGSLYPWFWDEDNPTNKATTVAEMERRACTAARTLVEYEGAADGTTCTNPSFDFDLIKPAGVINCANVARTATPCQVEVTLHHTFRIILPVNVRFFDVQLGLPSEVDLERRSLFAISDFEIDQLHAP